VSDAFRIDGPAMISFSGGRTSGYMLWRLLEANLWADGSVHVLFANTGKERLETLRFVEQVERAWRVPIHWVERGRGEVAPIAAARDGEPFEALIRERRFCPNPVARFCTQELKIRPMRDWMLRHGYEHWTNVVGIRADEPRRVAKMRASAETRSERWEIALPLAEAGVTEADVMAFWQRQPFDLELQPHEGNCDLCFLKGPRKRQQIMRDRPDLAVWWIAQEDRTGTTFPCRLPELSGTSSPGRFVHPPRRVDGVLLP
jgi:3'-phosphoadenosine 5'-phosphosulfate sulfotransferase (PAPS reductase)/FAD synthetase